MGKLNKKRQPELSTVPQDTDRLNKINGLIFIPTEYRRFIQIELDYTDEELFKKKPSKLIGDVKDAIVQITIRIKQEDICRLDMDSIQDAVKDAYHCKNINPIIVKERIIRNKKINADITPKKAIKLFIKEHNQKLADKIYKAALDMMFEVGVK